MANGLSICHAMDRLLVLGVAPIMKEPARHDHQLGAVRAVAEHLARLRRAGAVDATGGGATAGAGAGCATGGGAGAGAGTGAGAGRATGGGAGAGAGVGAGCATAVAPARGPVQVRGRRRSRRIRGRAEIEILQQRRGDPRHDLVVRSARDADAGAIEGLLGGLVRRAQLLDQLGDQDAVRIGAFTIIRDGARRCRDTSRACLPARRAARAPPGTRGNGARTDCGARHRG